MKRRSIALNVLFAVLALGAMPAMAQCPLSEFSITGRVVDVSGQPVPKARISAQWLERAAGEVSNQRETDSEGNFSIRIPFDTFSGRTFLGEARCEATLDRVTLTVTSPGYRPRVDVVDPSTLTAGISLILEAE
jgi:hypothetical protein